ncbi:tautomerase family protein [Halomonas sp. NPDC076908]|uniref:tautomerase family protein n=1 Tax=Halomonas sp. NPDC076908 TaxID=3390567 RepID=UPI0007496775|nr:MULTISPECIES: tautomerase family protein [unclassified Halomonas]KUJ87408.1 MAG: tautomerase [Halomonas sp. 54_146]HAA45465.1 tautomerase [Halomonas sp.]
MPVIHISTFKIADQEKAQALLEEVTAAMHRVTGVPLDKISAYLTEVEPSRWADAGILGSDPTFQTQSRRKTYVEEKKE